MEFKWSEDLLQKKFNAEIDKKISEAFLESLNKITPLDKITNCMNKFSQIQEAICTIEFKYGMHPNKIIIGSDLLEDFKKYTNLVKVEKSELTSIPSTFSTFCGVSFEVDEDNPNRLEIGYMIRLSWGGRYVGIL